MHILWWLALLIGLLLKSREWRKLLVYLAIAAIVPLTYFIVIMFHEKEGLTIVNITSFVLHDYIDGGAIASIDYRNFLLTPVSLFRSFFQIHGNILILLLRFPWLYGLAFMAVALSIWALVLLRKTSFRPKPLKTIFVKVLLLAFSLHSFRMGMLNLCLLF
ncbi:MAG TPA: hypothetical protein DEG09_04945 [Marinilabiliaceae bacterium]|nr:hypothetical protein [Marinilabiliaceae bacterium]